MAFLLCFINLCLGFTYFSIWYSDTMLSLKLSLKIKTKTKQKQILSLEQFCIIGLTENHIHIEYLFEIHCLTMYVLFCFVF